jgi:malonyl CoA-acyl carrier protein transacylase
MVRDGARRFVELGPGSVLTGLNRRNARDLEARAIGEPDDIAALG